MANLRKRIEWLERSLAPAPGSVSDPYEAMKGRALQSLSTEDLMVLEDAARQGKQECEWTERESAAVKSFSGAFEHEVRRAGYGSVEEFQSSCRGGRCARRLPGNPRRRRGGRGGQRAPKML